METQQLTRIRDTDEEIRFPGTQELADTLATSEGRSRWLRGKSNSS